MPVVLTGIWLIITAIGEQYMLAENCIDSKPCRGTSYNIIVPVDTSYAVGDYLYVAGRIECVKGFESDGEYGRVAYFCEKR